jgi:hypothetical protein
MNKNHGFYDISFLVITRGKVFLGVTYIKSSRDLTRPLGMPRDLKSLLHMSNAIVFSTKEEVM